MKRYTLIFLLLIGTVLNSLAQEKADKDIWYVWVDTQANVKGSQKRIVSKELSVINCCVKSPKYRKLLRSTAKWIRTNIDKDYKGNTPLSKVQDRSLAEASLAKVQLSKKVNLVNYEAVCEK